ncbi:HAD family hydrolase [Paludifilum halophilum]|uniref:Haloacid dehalogenase n=1 Tax=Paludifilum halophilum TaxID=1642702 RepID=A0A235B9J7_9BACL|nr:HAD family hydrolase [Paludifilum halophilum]OYD08936.1 hypothetical protein CHM34_03930 [Paludifilum halophilum]
MNPILISFDLDHTLMVNPFRRWVFPDVDKAVHPLLSSGGGTPVRRMVQEHLDRLARREWVSAYDWDDILRTITGEKKSHLPFTVEDRVRHYAKPGRVWLFADVLPVLNRLHSQGVRMVAATNGWEKYQRPVTDCLGITRYLDSFHTPDTRGFAKPHPDFFDFPNGHPLVHIGDRIDQDIAGANRAKVVSVWINRHLTEEWRLRSLKERRTHPDFPHLVHRQLKQEGWEDSPSDEQIPDYLITSLEELEKVLNLMHP